MLMSGKLENLVESANERDEFFMKIALQAAIEARESDEIPIGACLVDKNGAILAVAGNRTRTDFDVSAHAEILVLREAGKGIGNFRLVETTLFTTIEPCVMCAGAIVHARIKRLVYGAADERFGAVHSKFQLCDSSSLNHRLAITAGILETECRRMMQDFFRKKRKLKDENSSFILPPSSV